MPGYTTRNLVLNNVGGQPYRLRVPSDIRQYADPDHLPHVPSSSSPISTWETAPFTRLLTGLGFDVQETRCAMKYGELPPHRGRLLHYRRGAVAIAS